MHDFTNGSIHNRRIARYVILAAIALTWAGCGSSGPKYWPISGRVTFQGKPVTKASIRLTNVKTGIDVLATLNADGTYEILSGKKTGLPEATYQVSIVPDVDISNFKQTETGLLVAVGPPPPPPQNIPTRYQEPNTSGLTLTVKPESNAFDVDMQPGT